MSITSRQITLIQRSFAKVEPIADAAAEIFYKKLFEYDPSLRRMFKNDMKDQGRKLMAVLTVAVGSLTNLDQLVPTLHKLAERHAGYGVKPEDYTPVGNALLYTLKKGLGDEFTPELREAWISVFRLVANTMREHSYPSFDARTFKNMKRYNR
ncbi:MAG: hemin receptor [Gammaproteobacteria bacterium]|nr:hemin receptor [Gammaproteobacteria bacterium]